ncbi:MAG: peptide chain release factor aRF-1 [Candidatus Nanoarchaeia archaeon]|nr:peptide chain release factor aRF-1 [Candidatus Haiyanarchaeum thermophilum]MCW1303254.1 peptide chain release factor aRF-1 [Candidatus Haiyanarchaeum thermophilum]MCW1304014.1 peptide chain release factor aRF-1 [Candidatus Haiyanarchaeum thermophilum]MCW1306414.1 peptide chain release factor aRF-1 [Candidatus Haiyanarchaeum thermophilum]MCW1307288.1 peptide chain release factor aRF-1 [Candidatus Haiyanarchaeum thermophilum]
MKSELEKIKLKRLLEELKQIKGKHTELISIYVPADFNIEKLKELVNQELGTAQNIKSRTTRRNVIAALEKIAQELKLYKKIPENGLVIFSGNVSPEEGRPEYKIWLIEPPERLPTKLYRCDKEFVIQPLLELLEAKYNYGLIVIDKGHCAIGIVRGRNIECLKERDSIVPGKTRKGGQSAVRFERVRENLARNWYKSVADDAQQIFQKFNIKGLLIGGPGPSKEFFIEYLPVGLKEKIIAIRDTGYTDDYGLRELVSKSLDVLKHEEISIEISLVNSFFEKVAKNSNLVVYGVEKVKEALTKCVVEKLLISEEFNEVDELYNLIEKCQPEVVLVSTGTQEGRQFAEFCKIGAFLRTPLD